MLWAIQVDEPLAYEPIEQPRDPGGLDYKILVSRGTVEAAE